MSALALAGVARAEVQHTYQSWNAAFVQARMLEQDSAPGLWLDLHSRRASGVTNVLLRPGAGWYFNRNLSLWAGYLFAPSFVDGAANRYEHRPWQQLQLVFNTGDSAWTLRTRSEQRFMHDDADLGWRLRQLLRWQHSVGREIAVVVWDEIFWGLNRTTWGQQPGLDQNRAFLGPAWTPRKGLRLEGGYLAVWLRRPGDDTLAHVLSLNGFVSW